MGSRNPDLCPDCPNLEIIVQGVSFDCRDYHPWQWFLSNLDLQH